MPDVDDVAAVAASRPADEADHRREDVGTGRPLADLRAADQLLDHGPGDERAEREAHA